MVRVRSGVKIGVRTMRSEVTRAKRIVVKVGSSSLTGSAGSGLDSKAVDLLVDAVASAKARGIDVLVVTSGAIAAGLDRKSVV